MKEELIKMPKIELHLHLDGSVRPETASMLLNKDVKDKMVLTKEGADLNEYLDKFALPVSLLQTRENLERISMELAMDLAKENVIYAEIRFAPMKHLEKGLLPEEVIESILRGLSKVNIKTNLILCMMRGEAFEENKKVINLAQKYLGKGVCAIDLAGAEAIYPTKDYEDLFKIAQELKVPFTIHAGEADGPKSIEDAINFGTKRIGHGVRALENENTIKKLLNNQITLEVCPTSNINTSIFKKYTEHNIKKLKDLGLKITINTDNRTVSNITITKEYEKLFSCFGFSKEDFIELNLNAIEASFISKEEKMALQKIILEYN